MRARWLFLCAAIVAAAAAACGGAASDDPRGSGAGAGAGGDDSGATGDDAATSTSGDDGAAATGDASDAAAAPVVDTLDANRDRLLATYLAWLLANPGTTQTNGLSAANVKTVCDVWGKLDPSSRAVYLTLTARMQGSKLVSDGASMLAHVTKVYRVVGGQGATTNDPGSCGGGENNRMILSMDAHLHDTLVLVNQHHGSPVDIHDVPTHSNDFWRDSHDVGGPHAPFDLSDETDPGAPRGQTQFFRDPKSAVANAALGRQDLKTLVDPYALEIDQDYDCVHNSNPLCSYFSYGPSCTPAPNETGVHIYTDHYGSYEATWSPSGCAAAGDASID